MKKASNKKNEDLETNPNFDNLDEDSPSTPDDIELEMSVESDDDSEGWFIEKMTLNQRVSGMIVETKLGRGQTKNNDCTVGGKIPVYLDDGRKLLCSPEKLRIIGYYD